MSLVKSILLVLVALLAGLFVGGMVNMSLILASASVMPPPEGVDVEDVASINAHISEYSVAQLLAPFLAHALGTLVGAFVAGAIAPSARARLPLALVIGCLFLVGGAMAVSMIPDAPLWFDLLDLVVAYLPMAFLGARLASKARGDAKAA